MKKYLVLTALVIAFFANVIPASAQGSVASSCDYYLHPAEDLNSFNQARTEKDSKKIDQAISCIAEFPLSLQVYAAGLAANKALTSLQKEQLKGVRIELMNVRIQNYIQLKLGLITAQR